MGSQCTISMFCGAKNITISGGSFQTCQVRTVYHGSTSLSRFQRPAPARKPYNGTASITMFRDSENIDIIGTEFLSADTITVLSSTERTMCTSHNERGSSPTSPTSPTLR